MEIERRGGNCVVVSVKKDSFVIDPKLSHLGLKDAGKDATAILLTQPQFAVGASDGAIVIDGPGEYEVRNCSIKGVEASVYSDPDEKAKKGTIYRIDLEDIAIAVIGHSKAKLSDDELEAIGVVDILILPVGGYGYTLDPKEAVDLVRAIEPKVIIPTHYAEEGVTYEVPQAPLEEFLKDVGGQHEALPKLKVKSGMLPETLTVYELIRAK